MMETPLTPICAPSVASMLKEPEALLDQNLLRSYRADEWPIWFREAGVISPYLEGPIYDSSAAMAELAARGLGVALLPCTMFQVQIAEGRLVRPFDTTVRTGRYWVTRLANKEPTTAVMAFEAWICRTAQ